MTLKLAYAANRQIGLSALRMLLEHGVVPAVLLIPSGERATCVEDIRALLPTQTPVLYGKSFRQPVGLDLLRTLNLDYLLSVHFPYIFPPEVLALPSMGSLNLHPAYLPFNRGWHTPSWAILDGTPIGATLHWIDAGIDTGEIAAQIEVQVEPADTADTLYKRVLQSELDLLRQCIPPLLSRSLPRVPQRGRGSAHSKADLAARQELHLNEQIETGELLRRLRALSTNRASEHAYFRLNGKAYRVRISISDESGG